MILVDIFARISAWTDQDIVIAGSVFVDTIRNGKSAASKIKDLTR